jgi:hypothetical protein
VCLLLLIDYGLGTFRYYNILITLVRRSEEEEEYKSDPASSYIEYLGLGASEKH